MRTLLTLGLGALAMYLYERINRPSNRAYGAASQGRRQGRQALRTELEPDRPSAAPQGAQHLGR